MRKSIEGHVYWKLDYYYMATKTVPHLPLETFIREAIGTEEFTSVSALTDMTKKKYRITVEEIE